MCNILLLQVELCDTTDNETGTIKKSGLLAPPERHLLSHESFVSFRGVRGFQLTRQP